MKPWGFGGLKDNAKDLSSSLVTVEPSGTRTDSSHSSAMQYRYDDHRLIHDMLVKQATIKHELQDMRGRVTALEEERDHRE
nr:hypothetical protein [Tanacetum cinerariifolium]GEV87402.1 hypothetical protein [Tanacetum cinerariifolium]